MAQKGKIMKQYKIDVLEKIEEASEGDRIISLREQANACGIYVTAIKFQQRPLLENVYGQDVWCQIAKRFNEIIDEQKDYRPH